MNDGRFVMMSPRIIGLLHTYLIAPFCWLYADSYNKALCDFLGGEVKLTTRRVIGESCRDCSAKKSCR